MSTPADTLKGEDTISQRLEIRKDALEKARKDPPSETDPASSGDQVSLTGANRESAIFVDTANPYCY